MRVMMKMAAVSAVTALLLCCSAFAVTDAQDRCDVVAAVGSNFTVELKYALKDSQQLQWKHGVSTIYRYNPGKAATGNKDAVDDKGSLKLTKVDKTKEGMYSAEVHEGGKLQHQQSITLCTMDAVQQPTVNIQCLQKTPTVKFTCSGKQPQGVEYNWIHNKKVLDGEKGPTLMLKNDDKRWTDLQTDTFSCNVSNRVSTKSSEAVKQTCFTPKLFTLPETIGGINTWIIIGVGGGVVVLLMIIVIICCCRNRRKKRLRLKDEEELRLGWSNPNQQQHHHHHNHPPDHHHHHHHHQQQPAGHTGPRQHRTKQHRSQQQQQQQQRPRAPDVPNGHPQPSPRRPAQAPRPAGNTDDEQPPPLPQPRKKAPKTPRE